MTAICHRQRERYLRERWTASRPKIRNAASRHRPSDVIDLAWLPDDLSNRLFHNPIFLIDDLSIASVLARV